MSRLLPGSAFFVVLFYITVETDKTASQMVMRFRWRDYRLWRRIQPSRGGPNLSSPVLLQRLLNGLLAVSDKMYFERGTACGCALCEHDGISYPVSKCTLKRC